MNQISSALVTAFVSLLLVFAPLADLGDLERPNRLQTAPIIAVHLAPSYAVLAATSALRLSWILDGAKQRPVSALAGELSPSIGVSSFRRHAQPGLVHRRHPGQFRVVSDRSPPHSISLA
ncbi:MAG TPA: hypothetical protein VE422_10350 [Terriglobia bacterium]|nr:hypothetical protein [Terriglobia bacterium]